MPEWREVEDALAQQSQLEERRFGTERARRAAQLRIHVIRTQPTADDVARQRRIADAGNDEELLGFEFGIDAVERERRRLMREAQEQDALPTSERFGEAAADFE